MSGLFEPSVHVGIMSSSVVDFVLEGDYILKQNGKHYQGQLSAKIDTLKKISFDNTHFDVLEFESNASTFELKNVTIGKNFHWQQTENQRFEGNLKIIVEQDTLTAINVVNVEDYLKSVISSEMSATSSLELLKAHAVISRSWLISQIQNKQKKTESKMSYNDSNEIICWYDHDDHQNFDVCADDHCQRYQGITRETTPTVNIAINQTEGQVLCCEGKICDARFSKSCGGMTEAYEYCWDNTPHKYLVKLADRANPKLNIDLTDNQNAESWIFDKSIESFCNTTNPAILSQVLNTYDQKTKDFFRWKVVYAQEELSKIIKDKSGLDFGNIINITPIKRGVSGRIYKLKIEGEKKSVIVGKELEIRRWLSPSHLYSSAFVVNRIVDEGKISFEFNGAGWGHGVGLCQIGAAVMASKGYSYDQILSHYYPNTDLKTNYGQS